MKHTIRIVPSCILNLFEWSSICVQKTRKVVTTALRDNDIYYVVYKTAGNLVFRTLGPLVALIVLNAFLIRALHDARRRHQKLANSTSTSSTYAGGGTGLASKRRRGTSRHRENITLMLVAVVSAFIVCQLPDLGLRIATIGRSDQTAAKHFLTAEQRQMMAPVQGTSNTSSVPSIGGGPISRDLIRYVNSITNVLMVLNSAINFLIYCLVGKKFRRIFIQMFFGADTCARCWCFRRRGIGRDTTAVVTDGVEHSEFRRRMNNGTGNTCPPASQTRLVRVSLPMQLLNPVQIPSGPTVVSAECVVSSEREIHIKEFADDVQITDVVEDKHVVTSVHRSTSGDAGGGCRISVEVLEDVLENDADSSTSKRLHNVVVQNGESS